jgi:hypothetical protein
MLIRVRPGRLILGVLMLVGATEGCSKTPPPSSSKAPQVATSTTATLDAKPAEAQESADRVAAQWVVSLGGNVRIESAGKLYEAKSAADLPSGDFVLLSASLASNDKVTDDGLNALAGAKKLETLNLNGTPVTIKGVGTLGQLTGLKYLNLCVPTVGDAEMAVLATLPDLYALEISSTQVSDAGLEHLKKCRSLHTLYVAQTKVTDDGVASLKATLPNLEVHR